MKFIFKSLVLITIFIAAGTNSHAQEKNADSSAVDKKVLNFEGFYYSALSEKIKGNHQEAINNLKNALRFQPNSAEAQYELSLNYAAIKDVENSINYGENACRLDKENLWYWKHLNQLYTNINDFANMERCLAVISSKDQSYKADYYRSIAQNGKIDQALSMLNADLKLKKDVDLLILQRDIYAHLQKNEEAIESMKELLKLDSENPLFYSDLIESYLKVGDLANARKYTQEALFKLPGNQMLKNLEFRILMIDGNFELAFEVMRTNLNDFSVPFSSKLQYVVSFIEEDKGNQKTADLIKMMGDWLNESKDIRIYPMLANLYKISGDSIKAVEVFRQGFKNGYSEQSVLVEMLFLEHQLKLYDQVELDSGELLQLFPNNAMIYYLKGSAEFNKGKFKECVMTLSVGVNYALEGAMFISDFYQLMGDSYVKLKMREKALSSYNRGLKFYPDSESLKQKIENLK